MKLRGKRNTKVRFRSLSLQDIELYKCDEHRMLDMYWSTINATPRGRFEPVSESERKSIFHDYFVLKRFVKYREKRKQIYHFACRLSFSITCYHHLRFRGNACSLACVHNAHQITHKQYRVFHGIGSISRFKRYRKKRPGSFWSFSSEIDFYSRWFCFRLGPSLRNTRYDR